MKNKSDCDSRLIIIARRGRGGKREIVPPLLICQATDITEMNESQCEASEEWSRCKERRSSKLKPDLINI